MVLLDTDEFKQIFVKGGRAGDTEIAWALEEGRDELVGAVGLAAVLAAEIDYALEANQTQPDTNARFRRAIGYFAYGHLIFNVGSALREAGVVKREQGFADDTTVEYRSVAELEALKREQIDKGMKILGAYLLDTAETVTQIPVYRG